MYVSDNTIMSYELFPWAQTRAEKKTHSKEEQTEYINSYHKCVRTSHRKRPNGPKDLPYVGFSAQNP